jgi:hypothetical protein
LMLRGHVVLQGSILHACKYSAQHLVQGSL